MGSQMDVSRELNQKVMSAFIEGSACGDGPPLGDPTQFDLVRPMRAILSLLSQPHGSVKLWQGDTCIVAGAFCPSDVRMSKELPHRAAVEILFRPKVTGTSQFSQLSPMDPTLEERTIENTLVAIFENTIFVEDDPGCGFNIIIHEYENDGCFLASCVNAVALALLDGGCSMRSSVGAVTVLMTKDNKFIIDPSIDQQKKSQQALMTFVFSTDDTVLFVNVQGLVPEQILKFALQEARKAAEEVFNFYQFILTKKAQSYIVCIE